jgi:hypothetical protein
MDIRHYYQKIREVRSTIKEPFVVVVSQETPEGGQAGVMTEVPAHLAARLIVEGRAVLATEEQAQRFYEEQRRAREAAEQEALSRRIQVAVVSDNDVRKLSVKPERK